MTEPTKEYIDNLKKIIEEKDDAKARALLQDLYPFLFVLFYLIDFLWEKGFIGIGIPEKERDMYFIFRRSRIPVHNHQPFVVI